MASIVCGKCKSPASSVVEVKACYEGFTGIHTLKAEVVAVEAEVEAEAEAEAPAVVVKPEITEGIWEVDGQLYKVQQARESGRLYGKRLVVDEGVGVWDYQPGALRFLADHYATKPSVEDMKRFGHLYGVCGVCGRTLTNEQSIEAGIGPVCAGRAW